MSSPGSYLRGLRQRRGVSLDEMARATRVSSHYLDALERDEFVALPAPVFTKGFIRAYCQFLGEAPDEALTRYHARDGALPPPPVRPAEAGAPAAGALETRNRGAVWVSFVLLVVLGLGLFAVTLMLQPGRETRDRGAVVAGTDAARTPSGTVAPARVARPEPPAGGPAAAPVGDGGGPPYRLVARVSELTWIRVRTEDGRSTEETIPAGQVREWASSAPFVLTVGNAGGVTLELNGRILPPLGARGAVIPRLVVPSPPQ